MTKRTVISGLILLLVSLPVKVQAVQVKDDAKAPAAKQETPEKIKDLACDCCQKCRAAKGTIKSKQDEAVQGDNGCRDCCARCGKALKPMRKTPPEIIEKGPEPKQAGTVGEEPQPQERKKMLACDCCEKCKAAKGSIRTEEDKQDDEAGNGCEDCCARCGKPLTPAREDTPPEIMKGTEPPDIEDKQK